MDDGIGKTLGLPAFDMATMQGSSTEKLRAAGKGNGPKSKEQIEKAATDFEALLLSQMLKDMWSKTVPSNKDGLLSGSREEGYYREMLTEQFAKDIAEKQSLGIKDIIIKELTEREKS